VSLSKPDRAGADRGGGSADFDRRIHWSNPIGVWLIVYAATFLGCASLQHDTAHEPGLERCFAIALGMTFAAVVYWSARAAWWSTSPWRA